VSVNYSSLFSDLSVDRLPEGMREEVLDIPSSAKAGIYNRRSHGGTEVPPFQSRGYG
jgi:hypothetical protein